MSCSTDGLTIREMGELYQKVKRKIQRMEDELEMLRDRIVPGISETSVPINVKTAINILNPIR